jgi:hypothetical protein
LKSLQRAPRGAGNTWVREIKLHNLIAPHCAGVRNIHGDGDGMIG